MSHYTTTVLGQILSHLPKRTFDNLVGQHKADHYTKSLTTWNQFVALLFAQASGLRSLREIETVLQMNGNTWYHLGIKSISKSSLARANEKRSSAIFEGLFYGLLHKSKHLAHRKVFSFDNKLYALDATVIQLCLSLCAWAHHRKKKGALKIHTLLDVKTALPQLMVLTHGKRHDISIGKQQKILTQLEKGSILVFDRGYIDFTWWYKLTKKGVFFVSRLKKNTSLMVVGQHAPPQGNTLKDEYVYAHEGKSQEKYPEKLRKVTVREEAEEYEYVTNNLTLTGEQIREIYKARWQIESFFRWIKQNLKIKSFLGTSKNAVMTQIWVAMIYYLLLAYIHAQVRAKQTLLTFSRMIRESLLVRESLINMLSLTMRTLYKFKPPDLNQGVLL